MEVVKTENQKRTEEILKGVLAENPEYVVVMYEKSKASSCTGNWENAGQLLYMRWMYDKFIEGILKLNDKEKATPSLAPLLGAVHGPML